MSRLSMPKDTSVLEVHTRLPKEVGPLLAKWIDYVQAHRCS
jgi:hypothetical protein